MYIHVHALVCVCGGVGHYSECNKGLTIASFQLVLFRVCGHTVDKSEVREIGAVEWEGVIWVLVDIDDKSCKILQFTDWVTTTIDCHTRRVVTNGKELQLTSLPCRTVLQGVPI